MREQLGGRVGSDAGERRADVADADVAEFVADRTRAGEQGLAVGDVARLLHLGQELLDQILLFLRRRAGGGEHDGGFVGYAADRMRPQAVDVAGAEFGDTDAAVLHGGEEREGGFRALEQLFEDGAGAAAGVGTDQDRSGFSGRQLAHGDEQRSAQRIGRFRVGQQFPDLGQRGGPLRRQGQQRGGVLGSAGVGGRWIGEHGQGAARGVDRGAGGVA